MRDIAENLGVSIATVSRALHDHDSRYISVQTRKRVADEARRLGYTPNIAARALATGRTRMVAYWSSWLFTPYYARIAQEAYARSVASHYQIVFHSLHDRPIGLPQMDSVDGILLCDATDHLLDKVNTLRKQTPAVVSFGLEHYDDGDMVDLNLRPGAVHALQHLIARGRRRIALVTNDRGDGDIRTRVYKEVMHGAGLKPKVIALANQRRDTARARLLAYVDTNEGALPDALFCVNDDVAMGCYYALRQRDLQIPGDVALVGCDGIPDTEFAEIPISTITAPPGALGGAAWDLMEQRLAEPNIPAQFREIVPEFIPRESAG